MGRMFLPNKGVVFSFSGWFAAALNAQSGSKNGSKSIHHGASIFALPANLSLHQTVTLPASLTPLSV